MPETLGAKDSVPTHQFYVLSTLRIATGRVVFVLCLILGIVSATIAADDSYIAGYAAAVLEHEFNVPGAILQVQEGVVVVTADSLGKVDRQKVIAALEKIPGVVRAEVREGPPPAVAPAGPPPAAVQQEVPKPESKFLPRGLLVAPFHADPHGRIFPSRPVKFHWARSLGIPAQQISEKPLPSIATRLLWMTNGKSRSRPESSVYSI